MEGHLGGSSAPRESLGLKQVDTTKYLVMRGYVVSAIVTKLKMKLIFY